MTKIAFEKVVIVLKRLHLSVNIIHCNDTLFNTKTVENSKLGNEKVVTAIINLKYLLIIQVGSRSNPGNSCLDILQRTKGATLSSGYYWIVLDNETLNVYCDMKADGGMYLRFLCFKVILQRFY